MRKFAITVNGQAYEVEVEEIGGAPVYAADPAQTTAAYRAAVTDSDVVPGASLLCTLAADEVGSVEYWLFLEGCDENCIRAVQGRDAALQLGFAGVQN